MAPQSKSPGAPSASSASPTTPPRPSQAVVIPGSWAEQRLRKMARSHNGRSTQLAAAASTHEPFERRSELSGVASPHPARERLRGRDASTVEREVQGPSGKVYAGTSCWCLLPGHQPRRLCIWIVEARFFDPLILLTILANCATMAWESPLDPDGTSKAYFIGRCESGEVRGRLCERRLRERSAQGRGTSSTRRQTSGASSSTHSPRGSKTRFHRQSSYWWACFKLES